MRHTDVPRKLDCNYCDVEEIEEDVLGNRGGPTLQPAVGLAYCNQYFPKTVPTSLLCLPKKR